MQAPQRHNVVGEHQASVAKSGTIVLLVLLGIGAVLMGLFVGCGLIVYEKVSAEPAPSSKPAFRETY